MGRKEFSILLFGQKNWSYLLISAPELQPYFSFLCLFIHVLIQIHSFIHQTMLQKLCWLWGYIEEVKPLPLRTLMIKKKKKKAAAVWHRCYQNKVAYLAVHIHGKKRQGPQGNIFVIITQQSCRQCSKSFISINSFHLQNNLKK